MSQKKHKQKRKEMASALNTMETIHEENQYLIDMALEQGKFESKEDLDQWYADACFIKTMFPDIKDQKLMPEELDLLMLNLGLIKESQYLDFELPKGLHF